MIVRDEDLNVILHRSRDDLADLHQCLSGNHHFLVLVGLLQLDVADGNAVSVQRYDLQPVVIDLKQLACHQLVVVIVRDRKNSLTDYFLQCKLGNDDRLVSRNDRNIGKVFAGFSYNIEFCLLAGNDRLEGGICLDGHIIVRKFADNLRKDLGIQSDNASFYDISVDDRLNSDFHIIGSQLDLPRRSIDQNTFQDSHGRSGGNCLGNNVHSF